MEKAQPLSIGASDAETFAAASADVKVQMAGCHLLPLPPLLARLARRASTNEFDTLREAPNLPRKPGKLIFLVSSRG